MRSPKLIALAAASLIMTSPAFAASQAPVRAGAATQLSLAGPAARVGSPMKRGSKLGAGNGGWIIGAIGLVAGVTYAFIQKSDDDNDNPASP